MKMSQVRRSCRYTQGKIRGDGENLLNREGLTKEEFVMAPECEGR